MTTVWVIVGIGVWAMFALCAVVVMALVARIQRFTDYLDQQGMLDDFLAQERYLRRTK